MKNTNKHINPKSTDFDSSLTKQHFSTKIFKVYLKCIQLHYPEISVQGICERAGLSYDYIMDETNWVSVIFDRNFTVECIKTTNDPLLPYKSGLISLTQEGMGSLLFYLIKYTHSTTRIFKTISAQSLNFSKVMSMTVVKEGKGFIHIKYHPINLDILNEQERKALIENLDNIYLNTVGYIAVVPTIHGQPRAGIEHYRELSPEGVSELHMRVAYGDKNPIRRICGLIFSTCALFAGFGWVWSSQPTEIVLSELAIKSFLLMAILISILLCYVLVKLSMQRRIPLEAQKTIDKMDLQYRELQKAKETLKEKETLLRKMAENYPNSYVSIIESDFTVSFTSGLEFKKQNINPDKFLGLTLEEVFYDYAEIARPYYQETFHGKDSAFELSIKGQHQLHRTVPLYSEDGSIPRILVVIENITERKQFEDSLRESEGKYRSIMESMKADVYICSNDFRLEFMNSAMMKRTGRDATGELCYKAIHDFDDQCPWCMHEKVMQGENVEMEVAIPKTEKTYHISSSPIFHTDGLVSKLTICQDITSHRTIERNYRMLFREMLNGFVLHEIIRDKEGRPIDYRFIAVNPAFERMTGMKEEDVVDKTVLDLRPDIESFWIDTYGRVALNNEPAFFESYSKAMDKHFQVTAFQPASNQLAGIFVDITDIRKADKEKQALERQLQQSQKMEAIGTLAGGIAHDFNNILFPIIGYTEMMIESTPKGSDLWENLDEVLKSSLRARDLVKQILTFSRQGEKELKPVKMQIIVREVIKLMRATLPSTITIEQEIDEKSGMVFVDPTHIHQISMNLITNAYHAMEKNGGTLTVKLSEINMSLEDMNNFDLNPGKFICFSVSDTGHGIEKTILDRIFEPYFTTKTEGKGTGLGLSVVHGIVKSYGGDIRVYSEIDQGSVFHVYLPVIKSGQIEMLTVDQVAAHGGSEHILLVDDEQPILKMETKLLERLGYQVTSRTSSMEALEAFRSSPYRFDLVITDMTMPNMTGDKLAFELKNIRREIPVIICTGFSEKVSREKVKAFGIEGFLMKPIAKNDLANKVRTILNSKKGA